jgi:hypothetical protein
LLNLCSVAKPTCFGVAKHISPDLAVLKNLQVVAVLQNLHVPIAMSWSLCMLCWHILSGRIGHHGRQNST